MQFEPIFFRLFDNFWRTPPDEARDKTEIYIPKFDKLRNVDLSGIEPETQQCECRGIPFTHRP